VEKIAFSCCVYLNSSLEFTWHCMCVFAMNNCFRWPFINKYTYDFMIVLRLLESFFAVI
jgi:hypothetical protein